jgi:hypothetical protein
MNGREMSTSEPQPLENSKSKLHEAVFREGWMKRKLTV